MLPSPARPILSLFRNAVPRTEVSRTSHIQSRGVRSKGGTDFYTNSLRKDERLLRRLEAQLDNVQRKAKWEETEAAALMKQQQAHGVRDKRSGPTLPNHNQYFWDHVLTPEERRELARYKISSMDELYATSRIAEAVMARPPNPALEQLEQRLQIAYEMYKSIPEKFSRAGQSQANFGFGGWW